MKVLRGYPVVSVQRRQHGYINTIISNPFIVKYKIDWDNNTSSWEDGKNIIVRNPNCITENPYCPKGYDLWGEEVRINGLNVTGFICSYNVTKNMYEVLLNGKLQFVHPDLIIPIKYEQSCEDYECNTKFSNIISIVTDKIRRY